MASRPRERFETFSRYRGNLKREAKKDKERLSGYRFWPGKRGQAIKRMVKGVMCFTNGEIAIPLSRY